MKSTRLLPLVLTALIAACASTQEEKPADQATQSPAAATTPAPSTRTLDRSSPATTTLRTPSSTTTSSAKSTSPGPQSIYFDYDRDEIKPQFQGVIADDAKYLRENPAAHARIEGNADERGSREYNVALGQRRAEAVMKALRLLGVPADRMEAVSYGEEKPRGTGHDEASWAENRRDDVLIQPGK